MRARTEAAVAVATVLCVALVAAWIGSRTQHAPDRNRDASTFAADPEGARGLFDALGRLGIDAERFRKRAGELHTLPGDSRQLLAILDSREPLSSPEVRAVLDFNHSADLLIAGPANPLLFRCFGYRIDDRIFDSVRVTLPGSPAPRVAATLVAMRDSVYADSARVFDVLPFRCAVPTRARTTVLVNSQRGPVVVRLDSVAGPHGVILVSDVALLRNSDLRYTSAGVFVLQQFAGRYDKVIFDEYHQGYGASGSLARTVMTASMASPAGWMVWQCAAAGVLALLFGAIRFGPAVPGIVRSRRSSAEQVHALARALQAAHGHDEAIGAIVRGLQRRLAPTSTDSRRNWRRWLDELDRRAVTPDTREAIHHIDALTRPGQPAESVRDAANTVEELWQTLHH